MRGRSGLRWLAGRAGGNCAQAAAPSSCAATCATTEALPAAYATYLSAFPPKNAVARPRQRLRPRGRERGTPSIVGVGQATATSSSGYMLPLDYWFVLGVQYHRWRDDRQCPGRCAD